MATTATDSSGNGNNGIYLLGGTGLQPLVFPAGLIPPGTDTAWNPFASNASITAPGGGLTFRADWSVVCWLALPTATGARIWVLSDHGDSTAASCTVTRGAPIDLTSPTLTGTTNYPNDALAHQVAVTYHVTALGGGNAVTANWAVYIDGVAAGIKNNNTIGASFGFDQLVMGGGNTTGQHILDEFATFPTALSAGAVSALFAAGSSFAAYSAAVLADTPAAYYHYNDGRPNGWYVGHIAMSP